MTIGEFAETSRLSPKALRLYDQLGLVVPARRSTPVDGYRLYAADQVEVARRSGAAPAGHAIGGHRSVMEMPGPAAAAAVAGGTGNRSSR